MVGVARAIDTVIAELKKIRRVVLSDDIFAGLIGGKEWCKATQCLVFLVERLGDGALGRGHFTAVHFLRGQECVVSGVSSYYRIWADRDGCEAASPPMSVGMG